METPTQQIDSVTAKLKTSDGDGRVVATATSSTIDLIATLFEEAQEEIAAKDRMLLKSRPFSKSSFAIPFEIYFIPESQQALSDDLKKIVVQLVFELIVLLVGVKRLLKGRLLPPKTEIGEFIVDGKPLPVTPQLARLLQNANVNKAFNRAAKEISKDDNISSLDVFRGDNEQPFISLGRAELSYFRTVEWKPINEQDTLHQERVQVEVKAVVLEGKGKWRIVYNRRVVSVDIRDNAFLAEVAANLQRFGAGDKLDVDLSYVERIDPKLGFYTIDRKSYVISKVYGHESRKLPGGLLFE